MNRKIVALVLVLALCTTLSVNVFAATSSKTGQTNGLTSQIGTSATLYVDKNRASATTSADVESELSFYTSIIYYYTNENGQTQTYSDSGSKSAGAGTLLYNHGLRATSQHNVRSGNTAVGSWSCSLSASA